MSVEVKPVPAAVVQKLYRVFFSPNKYEVKANDTAVIEKGNQSRLSFGDGELAVTTWGAANAPAVLLMHGWGGARAQMTGFVEPLLHAGFRVVAYDQPAHGDSDGGITNILEISPTMNLIAQAHGPFKYVVAHSFGTLITTYAILNLGFPAPEKLVYFGAFNRLMDALPRFQALAHVSDEMVEALRAMINEKFGEGRLSAIVHAEMVKNLNIPALMFHDKADNVTPVEDSRAIAQTWPGVEYIETDGLGHRGALQSRNIHAKVVQFLTA